VVGLNAIVSDMTELLRRTLGEAIEVELATAPDLWPCTADPGQVQNALLNLAVNARDAMPGGGRLLIETMNARLGAEDVAGTPETLAGDYVVLTVSDSGCGMSAETAQRAFEPFFTTKAVGEGSGLGLSMVYGFAKQSGGHVSLYSEPGRGTTAKLYLPRAHREGPAVRAPEATTAIPRGSESILVVEDNDDMRDITREQLQRLGYRVVAVGSAAAGLRELDRNPDTALVLCDIVLGGGMSGPEFATVVIESRPRIAIVFMSGYSGRAAAEAIGRFPSPAILTKPFGVDELARQVRAGLERAG